MDEQRTPGEQTEHAATWLDLHDWRLRVTRLYVEWNDVRTPVLLMRNLRA